MTKQQIREKLIRNGVENLRVGGYPNATIYNILKDELYSLFFLNMLEENKGKYPIKVAEVDEVIEQLIREIKSKHIVKQASRMELPWITADFFVPEEDKEYSYGITSKYSMKVLVMVKDYNDPRFARYSFDGMGWIIEGMIGNFKVTKWCYIK